MNMIGYEERAKVYADALTTFGTNCQMVVALEEMSELQKEICKAFRGHINLVNLAEEVADVAIMLEQLRQIFGIAEMVDEIMDRKVLRLRQRIDAQQLSQRPDVAANRELFLRELFRSEREG